MTDIRTGVAAARTLPQRTEPLPPVPNIAHSASPSSDEPLSFSVEVERDRIAWLVRLRLIKPDEAHDLVGILAALNRIGLRPSISCSA
jgi:hypothetical protein